MEVKFAEKRGFPRIDCRAALRFQVRGEPGFCNSVCNNISLGGVGFICNKFISPNTPLMLEVNILSRVLHPIGKVAWSSPLAHSYRKRLGVEFLEFDSDEKDFLEEYINMQRSQYI